MAKKKAKKAARRAKLRKGAKAAPEHVRAFVAHSDAAPPDQAQRKEALDCIAIAFDSIGVPNVDDPSDQIDWGSFTKDDCNQLAAHIESCLDNKGWRTPALAGIFQLLRQGGRVMTVASLIDALIQISG